MNIDWVPNNDCHVRVNRNGTVVATIDFYNLTITRVDRTICVKDGKPTWDCHPTNIDPAELDELAKRIHDDLSNDIPAKQYGDISWTGYFSREPQKSQEPAAHNAPPDSPRTHA